MDLQAFSQLLPSSTVATPYSLPIRKIEALDSDYPPVVIEGLLRQSELLLMGGQAKRWKSWARADMLYCIANELVWLKFPTHQGKVIHFDLELLQADLRWRFEQIHQSYCKEGFKGSLEHLDFVALRGQSFDIAHLEAATEQLRNGAYVCASVDPIYRLLGGKGESDPMAVAELLNRFLNLGFSINSAFALLQHFTKGDQSQKESQDRFSGSSVWSRFPDSLLTFTDLAEQNCFSCEFTLRSFSPIEPFSVRWQFPRFRIDEALDPTNIKRPGRPKTSNAEDLCAILQIGESVQFGDFKRRALKLLKISSATFERRLREARNARFIFQSVADKGYGLTPEYISKNGELPSEPSEQS